MRPRPKQIEAISASVTRYYDSLTDEEAAENRAWGEFAALHFPTDECENDQPE
jgi:hypothetical protein